MLQKEGYSTAAFHSNPYLSSKFGYSRGFSKFEDFDAEPVGKEERIRGVGGQIHGLMAKLNNNIQTTLDTHGMENTTLYNAIKLLSFCYRCLIGYSGAWSDGGMINERAISWLEKNPNRFFL